MNTKRFFSVALALLVSVASASAADLSPNQVDVLLNHYFKVQDALASDDLGKAKNMAKSLEATSKGFQGGFENPRLVSVTESAGKIASAESMDDARASFEDVSNELILLVEEVGTNRYGEVHRMYCPMAFEGRRADWLQTDKELRNPYFGARMLRCGSRMEDWSPGKSGDQMMMKGGKMMDEDGQMMKDGKMPHDDSDMHHGHDHEMPKGASKSKSEAKKDK